MKVFYKNTFCVKTKDITIKNCNMPKMLYVAQKTKITTHILKANNEN